MKHEDDWLDALLHDDASNPIADAGFTQRVMLRLPAANVIDSVRDRRFERWTLAGAVMGTLIAWLNSAWPDTEAMASSITSFIHLQPSNVQALAPWLATLLVAAVLAYVMLEEQG
jgi:hypothetical protein